MSPEQKSEFDSMMKNLTAPLKPEPKKRDPGKLDYSHFESMPAEAQQACKQDFINSHKKMKARAEGPNA